MPDAPINPPIPAEYPSASPASFAALVDRLSAAAGARGFRWSVLSGGTASPVYLISPPDGGWRRPRLLVSAGLHGNEPSGSIAIAQFLETAPEALLRRTAISFLPIMNPEGLAAGTRHDASGADPNRAFDVPGLRLGSQSSVGRLIPDAMPSILSAGGDCALSLHEHGSANGGFYCYRMGALSGPVASMVRDIGREAFGLEAGEARPGERIENGIVLSSHADGSFEDWLASSGVPAALVAEIPQRAALEARVAAAVRLITALASFLALKRSWTGLAFQRSPELT